MIGALRTWLLSIIAAGLVLSILYALLPKGRLRPIVRTAGGVVLMLVILRPLTELDLEGFAVSYDDYAREIRELTEQYRAADNPAQSCRIARNMIFGKLYNARWSIERTKRDHALRVDPARLQAAIDQIKTLYPLVADEISMESLRGSEGIGAKAYFDVFDEMILQNKADFFFRERNRRPPLDNVNAMLSFAYSLLANDCAAALEAVGLDAYVGFLHRDRPGRTSLALDLMEELRPCFADRFVLSLINNRVMQKGDFEHTDSGAVLLTADGRKKFLQAWQERKRETITHPYLKEKLAWGLVPYVQALLLARYLRDDLDAYPPFLWK